jgi:type I restriction enzyme S subunit
VTQAQFDFEQAWAGRIPARWRWTRNKELLVESQDVTVDGSEELLSVSHLTGITPKSEKHVTMTAAENLDGYRLVDTGDLVINTMWAWMGALGVARRPGLVSPAYGVYRPRPDAPFSSTFYDYLYRSTPYVMEMTRLSRGIWSSRLRLYPDVFLRMAIPVPSPDEQRAIADYLDRENARIDTLIEEQQRLIEMLFERRLAVITESVVGASTTSRLAGDSAWYPSLPIGWGRGRVKSIATRVTDGAHISPDTDGGVFDFVSTRDLNGGSIDFDGALKTTPETYEYMVKTGCQPYDGDVLFSKDGTVGETAVVRGGRLFVVASSLVIVSPDRERVVSNYLAYVFASKTAREQAVSMMRGAGLPRLSVGNLARLEIPIPPLGEQRAIAAYLDKQTLKIDALIAESERFIELVRERRAALITAAVTGQIDVREMA